MERNSNENPSEKIKKLVALPKNRVCGDCNNGRSLFTNATIGTFVCTNCAKFLRALNPPHRIQSITLTNYTMKDVNHFSIHGNEICKKIWMKHFSPNNEYYSSKIDDTVRRQYLIDKYVNKKWLAKDDDFDQIKKDLTKNVGSTCTTYSKTSGSTTSDSSQQISFPARSELFIQNSKSSSIRSESNRNSTSFIGNITDPFNNSVNINDNNNNSVFDPFHMTNNQKSNNTGVNNSKNGPKNTIINNIYNDDKLKIASSFKSESNIFLPSSNGNNKVLHPHLGVVANEHPLGTGMNCRSSSQLNNLNKIPIFNNEISKDRGLLDPFGSFVDNNTKHNAIDDFNNINFGATTSKSDMFGAASVTDYEQTISTFSDKSLASTTFSHSKYRNGHNYSASESTYPFNPFFQAIDSTVNKNINGSFDHLTTASNHLQLNNSNSTQHKVNPFNLQAPSVQSVNIFTTTSPVIPYDNISVKSAFEPIHASPISNPQTYAHPSDDPLKKSISSNNPLNAAAVFSDNRNANPSNNFGDDRTRPFSAILPNSNHGLSNYTGLPINNNNTQYGASFNILPNSNSHTSLNDKYMINNTSGGIDNRIDLFVAKERDSLSGFTPNYSALSDLQSNFTNNTNTKIQEKSPELAVFDGLDPFQAMGFSKIPSEQPKKKITLSMMSNGNSIDKINSNLGANPSNNSGLVKSNNTLFQNKLPNNNPSNSNSQDPFESFFK